MKVLKFISKNNAILMTGAGMLCAAAAVVLTVPATIEIINTIDETIEKSEEDLTKKDIVKIAVRPAIKPVITLVAGELLIFFGARKFATQLAAVGAIAAMYEKRTKKIQNAVSKIDGVDINKILFEPDDDKKPKDYTDAKIYTFEEPITGQRIDATMTDIKAAVLEMKQEIMYGADYVSLNTFLDLLKLKNVKYGEDILWTIPDSAPTMQSMVTWDVHVNWETANGEPIGFLEYTELPAFS